MKEFDESIREAMAEADLQVPEFVHDRIECTLDSLPLRMPKQKSRSFMNRTAAIAACLAVMLLGVLPNVSVTYAKAVEDIPLIGALVQVLTIRKDVYEDGRHELDAEIPAVTDPNSAQAGALINCDINELTSAVISQFYQDLELSAGEGFGSVHIDYETLSNSPAWFTLKLTVTELAGSSNTYEKYYHIDRTTGNYVKFSDLFDSQRYEELEVVILDQMTAQITENPKVTYWLEEGERTEDFAALDGDQNFYFKENGNLVIVYDKYEVAPGYMGCPEFELTPEEYGACLTPGDSKAFGQR